MEGGRSVKHPCRWVKFQILLMVVAFLFLDDDDAKWRYLYTVCSAHLCLKVVTRLLWEEILIICVGASCSPPLPFRVLTIITTLHYTLLVRLWMCTKYELRDHPWQKQLATSQCLLFTSSLEILPNVEDYGRVKLIISSSSVCLLKFHEFRKVRTHLNLMWNPLRGSIAMLIAQIKTNWWLWRWVGHGVDINVV